MCIFSVVLRLCSLATSAAYILHPAVSPLIDRTMLGAVTIPLTSTVHTVLIQYIADEFNIPQTDISVCCYFPQ